MLTLGLLARTWLIEGLFVPLAVVSGSMADTLVGLHRDLTCGACGQRFFVGTDQGRPPDRATCPNCGCLHNDLSGLPDLAGDRVLMDKSALLLRGPGRFEVVAFRQPDRAADAFVKRVVGLPGEAVQVRDGDLYVDGRLVRKSLAQQRALGVLVHDASHPAAPDSGVPPRWLPRSATSAWQIDGGRFAHPGGAADQPADWCEYRHLVGRPGRPDMFVEAPIDDEAAYNQGLSRRREDVHPVADLRLALHVVEFSGPGELLVEIGDAERRFTVRIDRSRQNLVVSRSDYRDPIGGGLLMLRPEGPFELEVSIVDQQLLVAIDGGTRGEFVSMRENDFRPSTRPVAIGARGPRLVVDAVRLYRDVYYTRPIGVRARWGVEEPYRLGPEEYFVLGDNSPDSDDSRSWPGGPGVPGHLLIGRPFAVHVACRPTGWLGGRFQLPDLSRIRYIR